MKSNDVILVDEQDRQTGTAEKLKAHELGWLHRAFSVFITNEQGDMLLQRRALAKYHSGGLWTNSCCSHPYPGEDILDAAKRRLQEELGFVTELQPLFSFLYKADVGNGLTEHEYDHVFTGQYDQPFHYNEAEVMDCRFVPVNEVRSWLEERPEDFTTWFRIVCSRYLQATT